MTRETLFWPAAWGDVTLSRLTLRALFRCRGPARLCELWPVRWPLVSGQRHLLQLYLRRRLCAPRALPRERPPPLQGGLAWPQNVPANCRSVAFPVRCRGFDLLRRGSTAPKESDWGKHRRRRRIRYSQQAGVLPIAPDLWRARTNKVVAAGARQGTPRHSARSGYKAWRVRAAVAQPA